MTTGQLRSHTSHWGAFDAEVRDGAVVAVHPHPADPDPSPILGNIPGAVRHRARIAQPMVRAGWLDGGPGPSRGRGAEPFVPVSWETVTELLAKELRRVYSEFGGEAVYGGSYGWSSAGRFHHAQSQLHRFLNCLGGYVRSEGSYSNHALGIIQERVLGTARRPMERATSWSVLARHTDLFVCFGGIPLKNTNVTPGGTARHPTRGYLQQAVERGAEFVLFSPLRDDLADFVPAEWHAPRPGTDVAVMLGLAHTLVAESLHDRAFLDRYCAGYDRFERYLLGADDRQPKTADWAAAISGIGAETIRGLARRMAAKRTLINVNWSLQRIEHGEQAPWLAITLAAMLGQIGLPGGGYGAGYGSMAYVGRPPLPLGPPAFPQGRNAVRTLIPVARLADMLLNPGDRYHYDGKELTYPDIKLVYWSGGNPFHHHQDLNRLRRAFGRPDTIVVHDPFWTPMARHADIVLPATMTLERDDIGGSPNDTTLVAMKRAVEPFAEARDDYTIFSDLAARLGVADAFTDGRTAAQWIHDLYENWAEKGVARGRQPVPPFEEFWAAGYLELEPEGEQVLFSNFRANPQASPLTTPSGRIEVFSEEIAGFGYDDCPGHPTWLEPLEWLGAPAAERYPLHLIANNPATRLHSQLDPGGFSQASKVHGREPVRLHPGDAAARGIRSGDVVRLFNDRGACLAGAVVTDAVMPGVVNLSTGAWYDPLDPTEANTLCVHGNPNVLTFDRGTSKLAQGCSGQHALVQVERWTGEIPPIRAYDPPATVHRPGV